MINYNSALKVVNLGEPEASLILRKPRSPHGAGGADPSSPTGLTHVGGSRWESTESPAYRAILDWIREASRSASGHAQAETYSADSYSPGYEPALAGDGDLSTIWHTEFVGASPGYPHELVVDLGSLREVEGLLYVPRQDSPNGRVRDFEIRTSTDGRSWSEPLASGRWQNDTTFKYVPLSGQPARYVQLRGLSEVEGRPFMSAAEVSVESRPAAGTAVARAARAVRCGVGCPKNLNTLDTAYFAMQSKSWYAFADSRSEEHVDRRTGQERGRDRGLVFGAGSAVAGRA